MAGRDVLGLAQTGTGKTAAFVLPILHRLLEEGRAAGPRALVVAPTRELAAQVHAEFERLAQFTNISSVVVFGGVPIARQQRALRRSPDIVVACPGRLLDLLSQGALTLKGVEVLVLDEADHMFDMGFLPDLRRILRALPERRQNLLFSATMPREIRRLADEILYKPAVIELANSRPAETIEHGLYQITESEKVGALENLLGGEDFRSAIIFTRTKRRAKRLAERLDKSGHAAIALQGNMSQPQRERALKGFRDGSFDVLVATDIAARGLDIAGVSHVVNFDVPNTPDAYTHRIGRTGRSEQTGTAFTFVTPDDAAAVRAIEKRLGAEIERRRLSELGRIERGSLQMSKSRSGGQASSGPRGFKSQGPKSSQAGQRGRRSRPVGAGASTGRGAARGAGAASAGRVRPGRPQVAQPAARSAAPEVAFGLGIVERSSEARERTRQTATGAGRKTGSAGNGRRRRRA